MAEIGKGSGDMEVEKSSQNQEQLAWNSIRSRLRAELGEAVFNSWFKALQVEVELDEVHIFAPTRFICNWIENNYASRLLEYWQDIDPEIKKCTITMLPQEKRGGAKGDGERIIRTNDNQGFRPQGGRVRNGGESPYMMSAPVNGGTALNPHFTFENFMVGESNALAHATARRIADAEQVIFNPLFIYGGVGLGKTHLMHAIGWEMQKKHAHRKMVYISAEKFMNQFVMALRMKDMMSFKRRFREVDVLMLDDVQFFLRRERIQEEFFHTFNALMDEQRQLIISANCAPSELKGMDEHIRSRLVAGMVADIDMADYALRLKIVHVKASHLAKSHGMKALPEEILQFLAVKIVSNVRELEGALKRVLAYCSYASAIPTIETVESILSDLLRASAHRVTIDEIQRKVSEYYNVSMRELVGPRRARMVARPRQVAMYLAKQMTTRSLPDIGRKFGNRDHTTVIHAVRKITQLYESDTNMQEDVNLLSHMLTE